jgi:alkylation response protein AidB-like acyl-CoA dehydrogenase
VDFEPSEDQVRILEAVEALLQKHAGPARAVSLAPGAEYDFVLDAALAEAGFADMALGDETGPLEAALAALSVARAAGVVSFAAGALVAPLVAGRSLPGPVAIGAQGALGAVRFGAHARTLLLAEGATARVIPLEAGDVEPVASNFGYPIGRIRPPAAARGERLGPGSGERLLAWWRVALALEATGTMEAALAFTLGYVKQRRQFGHAIGSFQAVQHRLAECSVLIEGSHWLALEAAADGAPAEAAATAAAHATASAARVFTEMHQLNGAIGFTREHDLHAWTMRLPALRLELGGVAAHRRAAAAARYGGRS